MDAFNQISFKRNIRDYQRLKENSYFFKELNRGNISYKQFSDAMKEKYKERTTDKMDKLVDNIELISSVLNVLK